MVIVEAIGGGKPLHQELRRRHGLIVGCYTTVVDQAVRMETGALAIERGEVFIPTAAEWLETFRNEVVTFPMGQNDDMTNSMSQLLKWRSDWHHRIKHGPFHR